MRVIRAVALVALAAATVAGAFRLVLARGVSGEAEAGTVARDALHALGYTPVGEPQVTFESNQSLAWALERSLPGPDGAALARGEGGAVRWRVRFPEGGEAVVTAGGVLWEVRRPVPQDPGPTLFPSVAQMVLRRGLSHLAGDAGSWRWAWSQSWREGDSTWHRALFIGSGVTLPEGWQSRMEVELVGSAVVGMRRRVYPQGTDLGVVMGRAAELGALRSTASVGLVLVLVALGIAGAEEVAFHRRIAVGAGLAMSAVAVVLGRVSGEPAAQVALAAMMAGGAVAFAPHWRRDERLWPGVGAPAGVALGAAMVYAPAVVLALGGWLPLPVALPADTAPATLAAHAWLPAVVEEPVLRGALPGLVAPFVGWWGGALAGAALGAFLHPVPAVPLVAAFAVELVLQAGIVVVARWGGVTGAIVARGIAESVLRRRVYPGGTAWDLVALGAVALGVVVLLWPRRRD